MVMTDPIADMLTRIRNANMVRHEKLEFPGSNLKKEVAEILNISPRTVQTQLFRAIDKLRITLLTHKEGKSQSGNNNKLISDKIISLIFLISITNYF